MEFNFGSFGWPTYDPKQDYSGTTLYWLGILFMCIAAALIIAAIVVCFVLRKTKFASKVKTRDLTYGAICLSLSFALSFIGLSMPQGGTITFASCLPMMIYCYYFGFRKGLIMVTVFTLLQFVQKAYIVHPFSAVLDYVIPYMSLSVIGLFNYQGKRVLASIENKKPVITAHGRFFIGVAIYLLIRYISHILSGMIFFSMYAWEGWGLFTYSMVYNSFILIDTVIAAVAGLGLLSSKAFNTFMTMSRNTLKNSDARTKNN